MSFLLYLALIPVIIIGVVIYKNDKVEKESTKILIKVFCGGILAAIITLLLSGVLEIVFPFFAVDNESNLTLLSAIPYYFIGVALVEEFSKWLFVYLFCWKYKGFDYLYDGIVYCVFASLGFAAIENILYVFVDGIGAGIMRGLFAVPGHAFFAVYMGYYLGMSKVFYIRNERKKSTIYFLLSIIIPTIIHGLYDYLLSISSFINPLLSFAMFIVFMVLLYIFAIKRVRKVSNIRLDIYNNQV